MDTKYNHLEPIEGSLPPTLINLHTLDGLHYLSGESILPPLPESLSVVYFGMGCFWGAERTFWALDGVHVTAVGYSGGSEVGASYEEVCKGDTGHVEAVLVVYDQGVISFTELLKVFWEHHDPTQGDRQGSDLGSQYRSMISATTSEQLEEALISLKEYSAVLSDGGFSSITTEIVEAGVFYYAEEYHQQYLAKGLVRTGLVARDDLVRWYREDAPEHPISEEGYCSMRGLGVACSTEQMSLSEGSSGSLPPNLSE